MVRSYDKILTKEEKEQIVVDYVANLYSIKEIQKKYNIKSFTYVRHLIGDKIRSLKESAKIACDKYKHKHTEETKKILSIKQKKYIKNHQKEFSERLKKKISYPEKMFMKFLKENNYDKRFLIEREFSVYPYFIDFAFVDIKLAVEIDGSQHLREDRIKSDRKKDNLLKQNGWKVLRFSEQIVKKDWELIDKKLKEIITSVDIIYEKVGIIKSPKKDKTI